MDTFQCPDQFCLYLSINVDWIKFPNKKLLQFSGRGIIEINTTAIIYIKSTKQMEISVSERRRETINFPCARHKETFIAKHSSRGNKWNTVIYQINRSLLLGWYTLCFTECVYIFKIWTGIYHLRRYRPKTLRVIVFPPPFIADLSALVPPPCSSNRCLLTCRHFAGGCVSGARRNSS